MSRERLNANGYVEDLSVLSRRGTLPGAAQDAFADALARSATLNTAHRVGLAFDQIVEVRAGDEALIAEMATRALGHPAVKSRRRWGGRALLLVASLALAGSAAAWWQSVKSAGPVAPIDASHAAAARPASAVSPPRAAASAESAAPIASSAPQTEGNAETAPSHAASARPPGGEEGGGVFASAEALFKEANAARRAGDNGVARALYLRLEREFPASNEAQLAYVSLGNLLLRMGRAAEAEQQFSSYAGSRGALAQEALVGRAQSLGALGRDADEQRVWRTLLSNYPDSVYAGQARKRLATLERAEPARP